MLKRKLIALLLTGLLSVSALTGCGNQATSTADSSAQVSSRAETRQAEDGDQARAKQLLADLEGSYQELWPVILADQYQDLWLKYCKAFAGEANAQAAYEKLRGMVTAPIYGEEAVQAYQDNPEASAYHCDFTQNIETITFKGDEISGLDAAGQEVFKHKYHYVGKEDQRGLYIYESDAPEAGEFRYFFIAPDTPEKTYHIEFRYGSDRDQLSQYDQGPYAYWLASGIAKDYDGQMVEKCIKLFCEENLSPEEK
ncbi:hypothetical protein ACLGL1_09050 [Peptococcus simiae]|uniref:hypothetical protein n=1 Tax=Peptococcus simiae TaxID=1643805 RepID=UPI00397F12A4